MIVTARKRAEMEDRRSKVAANLLSGMSVRDIAGALNVSIGLVSKDTKVLFARWRSDNVSKVDDILTIELRRFDRALNAIWNEVLKGELDAIETFRKLSESRRKLIGLDAPSKQEVTGKDGGPVKIDTQGLEQATREIDAWRRSQAALIAQISAPTE